MPLRHQSSRTTPLFRALQGFWYLLEKQPESSQQPPGTQTPRIPVTFCLHCLSCSLAHSTSVPLLSPAFLKPAECMCPQDLCTNRPSVCRTPPPRSHRLAFIPPSDICFSAPRLSSFFPTTDHHDDDALLQSQSSQPQLITVMMLFSGADLPNHSSSS